MPMVDELDAGVTGKEILIHPTAVGVTAAITPWNFPIAMLAKKVALASRRAARWCSSPRKRPRSALAFGEICSEEASARSAQHRHRAARRRGW